MTRLSTRLMSVLGAGCAMLLTCAATGLGQTFVWNNSSGGSFATGSNWTPIGPPNMPTHTGVFSLGSNYRITSTGSFSFGTLLTQSGSVGFSMGAGTINVGFAAFRGGTVDITNGVIVSTSSISLSGSRLALNGGSRLVASGTLNVGDAGSATLEGGNLVQADVIQIGSGLGGAGRVTGGFLRANMIQVGDGADGAGTLTLADIGGISDDASCSVLVTTTGSMSAGANVRCPIHFDGNLSMFSGSFKAPVTGTGSLTIAGGNVESTISNSGSTNISGGSLEGVFSNLGVATISGGTLLAGMNNASGATLTKIGGRINGAIANDGTVNLRLAAALPSLQIDNSPTGTVVVGGPTTINAGTINNQGTLGGAGTLQGSILVRNLGTLTAFGASLILEQGVSITNLTGGLIRNQPLTSLSIREASFANQGNLEVNAGGGIDFAGSVGVSPGQRLNMLGGVFFSRGNLTINAGGALVGYGQINTDASFALNNSGSISFNGQAQLQTNLNNTAGGVITVRNGTTIVYGNATNAGTITMQNGTFIVANDAGALDGSGAARVLAGGAVVASQVWQSRLSIEGSQLQPAVVSIRDRIDGGAASRVNELIVTQSGGGFGGAIDLADTGMVIDYVPGNSPVEQIAALLKSGYAGGDWTGRGIQSRVAAADATGRTALGFAEASAIGAPPVFLGVPIDPSCVLIAYTIYGDANLSGTTDIDDFGVLASNFNLPGGWGRGDFNYSGTVDIDDFGLLAANFNEAVPAALVNPRAAAVPEAGVGLLALLAGSIYRPRRRAH